MQVGHENWRGLGGLQGWKGVVSLVGYLLLIKSIKKIEYLWGFCLRQNKNAEILLTLNELKKALTKVGQAWPTSPTMLAFLPSSLSLVGDVSLSLYFFLSFFLSLLLPLNKYIYIWISTYIYISSNTWIECHMKLTFFFFFF